MQMDRALRWSSLLYTRECGEERWFLCSPIEGGQMAVLDAPAMALFELFQQPMTVGQACILQADQSARKVKSVVRFLYQCGFLRLDTEATQMQKSTLPEQLTAWIIYYNDCNLRCDYCYLEKTHEDLPEDVGRRAVDAVFRSALKHHIRSIKLKYAGGEASLHMKALTTLHDYATRPSSI